MPTDDRAAKVATISPSELPETLQAAGSPAAPAAALTGPDLTSAPGRRRRRGGPGCGRSSVCSAPAS